MLIFWLHKPNVDISLICTINIVQIIYGKSPTLNMAKANTKVVKALGKRIDQLRKEREWSMREMADYCDIDKAQVNELTKDSIDFRYTTLVKIAKGFGITVSELLDF
jgi:plasmid maintenance system antidote protein VapI